MTTKINVLFTIPNFETAGSQYVLLAIFERLDRSKFNPFVLVEKFPGSFPDAIPKEKRLYLDVDNTLINTTKAYIKIFKKHHIHIVHSWDYKSAFVEALACKLAGVTYIYTKKNNSWHKRWQLKSWLSSHIAYNNPEMLQRFFNTFWLKNKVSFIPHGIDLNRFSYSDQPKKNSNFIMGLVGVLNENKNQLFVLEALKKLPDSVNVHIYGNAVESYKKLLQDYIETNGLEHRVSFKGYVSNKEMPNVIRTFDVLVLASKNEGLPICLIEAMACGVPVLSSDSGGGARYILKDNQGGLIFNLDTTDEFVDIILRLNAENSDLKSKLSTSGVQRVKDYFNIERETELYQELYEKLLT